MKKGSIALISLLAIAAVAIIMIVSISEIDLSVGEEVSHQERGIQTFYLAQSCIEKALAALKIDPNTTGATLNLDQGACTMTISGADQKIADAEGTTADMKRAINARINLIVTGEERYLVITEFKEK